ncbi:hypothetical protein [Halorubrum laminariae]|uniref:Uncharacterized protein n=1 Tax=Halorubrum laminariae TaxID=1433523 RepID=A0ABD6C4V3_9EURY|nr:hypothetical protein [Halorubrum laminariae]
MFEEEDFNKADLVNTEPTSDVGTTFRNTLSEAGLVCYSGMVELGLDKAHAEYVDAIKKYNNLSEEYTDKAGDKKEWFNWFVESDALANSLLDNAENSTFQRYAPGMILPEPLQDALSRGSIEPLLTSESDDIDILLWKFGFVEILRELHVHRIIPRDEGPPEVTDSPVC